MSFEELRAQSRGWLKKFWGVERRHTQIASFQTTAQEHVASPIPTSDDMSGNTQESQHILDRSQDTASGIEAMHTKENNKESKVGRPKKMKVMEVKGETQTSKTTKNLQNPDCIDKFKLKRIWPRLRDQK